MFLNLIELLIKAVEAPEKRLNVTTVCLKLKIVNIASYCLVSEDFPMLESYKSKGTVSDVFARGVVNIVLQ